MVLTLKDMKHLELMAKLEQKSTPKVDDQPVLSVETKSPLTEVFDQRLVTLCSKLRDQGLAKQANSLEQVFLSYKVAAAHLQKSANGPKLIEMAHPDGEVEVAKATDDHGVVETILTQQKKDLEIVNKSVSGTLPKKKKLALNKTASTQTTYDLNKYVDACKTALAGPLLIPVVLWIWSKTRRLNQGLKENTEILISEIADVISHELIVRTPGASKKLEQITNHLKDLLRKVDQFESIEVLPSSDQIKTIDDYRRYLNEDITGDLESLARMMSAARKQDENKMPSAVYRTFVASDFEDVEKAIRGFIKAKSDMMTAVDTAKLEAEKNVPTPTVPAPSNAQAGLSQLSAWQSSVPAKIKNEESKLKVVKWMTDQAKEFEVAAKVGDDKKIQQLLAENEDFKQKLNKAGLN